MATTSLWRVRGYIGKVLLYAENPEKTTLPKSIGFDDADKDALEDVIAYASREEATNQRQLISGINCCPKTARTEMLHTKEAFDKESGTIAYHGYQSFQEGEVTPELAHIIGVRLATELWGDKYEVIVATHVDKASHIHNHFVINTVSFVDGRKFHRTIKDYLQMREKSDALCKEYGLSVIENPLGKGKHYAEWLAERNGEPTWRSIIRDDVDVAVKSSITFQQFVRSLKDKGYEVERRGTLLRLRPPGKERFVRFATLGENYTEEAIVNRILRQQGKRINSSYGTMDIQVPQDRKSTFEPQVVRKRQKDISSIDQKIISMYAKGMTTRQISETLEDIYGFEASEGFISDVTDKILPQIEDWQKRPLAEVYPVLYIDAIHYSVRDNGVIRKLAAYVILGINMDGQKEVLTIQVGENESSKYWLSVLNELKNRGVKDILIICADGLSGIKEAIAAAYPKTEYQRCIVHQVRNTLKYVADKDRKPFANDLKTIYQAPSEEQALEALERVTEKWSVKYPNSMKSWKQNWDAISPIFKFSTEVRKVIYTTNAIESLNSTYRKLNRQRSVFPSDTALLKALYLATFEATKKWTMPIRNWGQVYGELSIMYEGRLPE